MMRVRQRRYARERAHQGIPRWKHAFGYVLGDHTADCPPGCKDYHHQPDPATAPLVKQAYLDLLAGASLGDICRTCNDAGALTLRGKRWTQPQMSNFLRKARNAGLRAHDEQIVSGEDGQAVKGNWPPLVDESTWRAAQNVLNAPGRAPGRKSVRQHLLTGLLTCGRRDDDGNLCGGRLSGHFAGRLAGVARALTPSPTPAKPVGVCPSAPNTSNRSSTATSSVASSCPTPSTSSIQRFTTRPRSRRSARNCPSCTRS